MPQGAHDQQSATKQLRPLSHVAQTLLLRPHLQVKQRQAGGPARYEEPKSLQLLPNLPPMNRIARRPQFISFTLALSSTIGVKICYIYCNVLRVGLSMLKSKRDRESKNDVPPDQRQEAQERLRSFREMRRLTQGDVAKRTGCSRVTVNRCEGNYDGLPKKPTLKARSRLVHILLQGYGLYQEEADEILTLLGFGPLQDGEWNQLGNPAPHFSFLLQSIPLQQQEDRFQLPMVNFGFHIIHAELHAARKVAEELLALAEYQGDSDLLVDAHCALGMTLFHIGDLGLARKHLEHGIHLSSPYRNHSHASFHAVRNPRVLCASFLSHTLLLLGYPDQALKMNEEALHLAREISLSEMSCTHFFSSAFHSLRREVRQAQAYAQSSILLSTEFGAAHWAAKAGIIRGWTLAKQGQVEEGIRQIQRNLANLREARPHLAQPYYLSLLAEAYGACGHVKEGLHALAEARPIMEQTGEYVWETWLYLTQGKLHWRTGDEATAEEIFQQAIGNAHRQGVKLLELRAAIGLSRLWQHQGKSEEARRVLEGIYNWFGEGFDTPDLKDARALLKTLL